MDEALYELVGTPTRTPKAMILALHGWIDAGNAASMATNHLSGHLSARRLADFNSDALLDHRARRPIVHIIDGVNTGLTWPQLELHEITDDEDNTFLLLSGPEPDRLWHRFADEICALAIDWEVELLLGVGAYPAAVPHTRDTRLSMVANTDALGSTLVGYVRGTIDVPAGVQAVIEHRAAERELGAIGVWAQVPHYAATMAYAPAGRALVRGLAEIAHLKIDTTDLDEEAEAAVERLNGLVGDDDEQRNLLLRLEEHWDAEIGPAALTGQMPSADELADSFQEFLRDQSGS